jgi:hypothetical protein
VCTRHDEAELEGEAKLDAVEAAVDADNGMDVED